MLVTIDTPRNLARILTYPLGLVKENVNFSLKTRVKIILRARALVL